MHSSCRSCLSFRDRLKFNVIFLWGGWKMTKLDFSMLSESLFAQSQVWILLSSVFMLNCSVARFLCLQNRLASSANRWKSKRSEQHGSHLYITKKYWSKDRSLRNAAANILWDRGYIINSYSLLSITEIRSKPTFSYTSYTIVL